MIVKFFSNQSNKKPLQTQKIVKPSQLSSNKIHKTPSLSEIELISKLKPGYVLDACTLMNCSEFPQIIEALKPLSKNPFYISSKVVYEFEKPDQKVWNCSTGRYEKRDFDKAKKLLEIKLSIKIMVIETNNVEVEIGANRLLKKYGKKGLHWPDNIYFALAKFTKSTLVTSDLTMINICKLAKHDHIEFNKAVRTAHKTSVFELPSKFRKKQDYYNRPSQHNRGYYRYFRYNQKVKRKFYGKR